MTDNEIIKAWECCANNDSCPADCPLFSNNRECLVELLKPTLDLINRQKAEIERLQGLLSEWKKEAYKLADSKDEHFKICDEYAEKAKQRYSEMFDEAKGKIKAEAVKEFAERLKEKFACLEYVVQTNRKMLPIERVKAEVDAVLQNGCSNVVDKILKEMVGEG